jgi:hypothetical protein
MAWVVAPYDGASDPWTPLCMRTVAKSGGKNDELGDLRGPWYARGEEGGRSPSSTSAAQPPRRFCEGGAISARQEIELTNASQDGSGAE